MGRSIVAHGCPPEKLRIHSLGIPLEAIAFQPRRRAPGMPLRVLIEAFVEPWRGRHVPREAISHIDSLVKEEARLAFMARCMAGAKGECR